MEYAEHPFLSKTRVRKHKKQEFEKNDKMRLKPIKVNLINKREDATMFYRPSRICM